MTLEEKWPKVFRELVQSKDILEERYLDICGIDFTIEHGKFFIVGTRIARRSPIANLRVVLDFFSQGKIDLPTALSRINVEDVAALMEPKLLNRLSLVRVGTGLPARFGIAVGRLALSEHTVAAVNEGGESAIFVRHDVLPEDLKAMSASAGVLTSRGGFSCHAALACPQLNKVCVCGLSQMDIRYQLNEVFIHNFGTIKEGSWLTIDGHSGHVYVGRGQVMVKAWKSQPELVALSEMIECAIISGDIKPNAVGRCWRIRDFFCHSISLTPKSTRKRPSIKKGPYISFKSPRPEAVKRAEETLHVIPSTLQRDYSESLLNFSDTLARILSGKAGVGKHYLYFRPLWDPQEYIREDNAHKSVKQLVGFEYYNINQYAPNLVDLAVIRFIMQIGCASREDTWFLDFTNPKGESLVVNSTHIKAFAVRVNDAILEPDDLPMFFNVIRKREYFWHWFKDNNTSYSEIANYLKGSLYLSKPRARLTVFCEELGLLKHKALTMAGRSLTNTTCENYL